MICLTDFPVLVLGIYAGIIPYIMHQQYGRRKTASVNFSHQSFISFRKMFLILIVYAKLHNHEIRLMPEQILLHPGNPEL